MRNLTSPQAILLGLGLIAFAIASIPYSSNLVTPVLANSNEIHKVVICNNETGFKCGNDLWVLSQ